MSGKTTNLIIGHTKNDSVKIWCRGTNDNGTGQLILSQNGIQIEEKQIEFSSVNAYTQCVTFQNLRAENAYDVRFVNGATETKGTFKTFQNPGDEKSFSFMFSSCLLYRKFSIGKEKLIYPTLKRIADATNTAFTIFCGDQIYVDTASITTPKHPVYDTYKNRYDECWSLDGAAEFFSHQSCYMILDDHELANNFDNAKKNLAENKKIGLQVYDDFQHVHNPDTAPGTYYYNFDYGNVSFFVFDTRSERNSCSNLIITPTQMNSFIDWLSANMNKLKIVVCPVPFIIQTTHEEDDKWYGEDFKDDHRKILNKLLEDKITDIFFITGDVHSAVHGRYSATDDTQEEEYIWHEFMSGPLNQVLVNGEWMFEKTKAVAAQGELTGTFELNYERVKMNDTRQNACVITVNFSESTYNIVAAWYRAQDKSKVILIDKSEITIQR